MSAESWRLIDTGPGGAFFNMALDEAIARLAIEDNSPPTLRVYCWIRHSVTLGRFQMASDVDTGLCAERGIPFVRRPTGGRAILHGVELTYSFSAPTGQGPFIGDLFSSYSTLSGAFLEAFRSLGLNVVASGRNRVIAQEKSPLCFSSTSFGEITLKGKKIIGSAQRRWPGGMLQQGSIPLEVPRDDTESIFSRPAGDTGGETEGLMGLREVNSSITYGSLKEALVEGFTRSLGVDLLETGPSERETELAARLEAKKYRTRKWNYLR